MAIPLNAPVPPQAAQQKLQDPAELQQKAGKSNARFDERMQSRAQSSQNVTQVAEAQKAQATQRVAEAQKAQQVGRVEQVKSLEQVDLKKVNASSKADIARDQTKAQELQRKGDSPGMKQIEQSLDQLQSKGTKIDDIIKKLSSGKVKLDQRELLKMQVQVYGYSMELDLTGKVVEKATSGLKDTLKTQV